MLYNTLRIILLDQSVASQKAELASMDNTYRIIHLPLPAASARHHLLVANRWMIPRCETLCLC